MNLTEKKLNLVLVVLLAVSLVLVPFFPDIQITRPKLLVLELSVFTIILLWLMKMIISEKIILRKTGVNIPVLLYIVYMLESTFG